MGLTHVDARIMSFDGTGESFETRFLVDTGAMDCLAPCTALMKAGIRPEGVDTYERASGELMEYPFGWGRILFMDANVVTKIIFGPDYVEPILGVMALESAGIVVDPRTQALKRLAARSLKASRALPSKPKSPPPTPSS